MIKKTQIRSTGEILKKYREKAGMTITKLAEKLEKSVGYINDIEKSRKPFPKTEVGKNLISILKISDEDIEAIQKFEDYLKTPEGVWNELEKLQSEVVRLRKLRRSDPEYIDDTGGLIRIPVYHSASEGVGLKKNPKPLYLVFPESLGSKCVVILIHEDCMEPTLKKDESLILLRLVSKVQDNDIGIFIHEGEVLIRRYRCFDDKCFLYSDNPKYPSREIRENDKFKVCGKVVLIGYHNKDSNGTSWGSIR